MDQIGFDWRLIKTMIKWWTDNYEPFILLRHFHLRCKPFDDDDDDVYTIGTQVSPSKTLSWRQPMIWPASNVDLIWPFFHTTTCHSIQVGRVSLVLSYFSFLNLSLLFSFLFFLSLHTHTHTHTSMCSIHRFMYMDSPVHLSVSHLFFFVFVSLCSSPFR